MRWTRSGFVGSDEETMRRCRSRVSMGVGASVSVARYFEVRWMAAQNTSNASQASLQ